MAKRTRTEYSTLNIIAGIGGYAVNLIMGIICRMIFTRTLAADYLGINGLFTDILSMLSLAELGIGSAIGYALYKPLANNDENKIASLMRFYSRCYCTIGAVIALLGLALLPFLHLIIREIPDIKENIYLIYVLYLFNSASSYFFSYRGALLTAAQQNYLVIGTSYLVMITQSVIQIVILLVTRNYLLYLLVLIIGGLSFNIIISKIAKQKYPYIANKDIQPLDGAEKKELVTNIRALTIWKLSGLLVNQTDNMIITYFKGLATVGLASNYTLLSGTLTSLINLVFNGITASVGNHNALETTEHKYSLFKSINLANFWFFGWAAIGIFVCSSDMVAMLFGESYRLSIEIPLIIAINFYMVGMQNAIWTYKNTMGLFRQGRYLLFLTAAINIVMSIWLGSRYGLFGILLATAISRLFTNTWYDPYAIHKYGFGRSVRPYFVRYAAFAGLLAATAAVCFGICALFRFHILVNVILKILVCSLIPNAVFWLCFSKTQEFSHLLKFARRILDKLTPVLRRLKR